MDTKEELRKWKDDYAKATTTEAKTEHQRRFKEYLHSLPPDEQKEFAKEFQVEAKQAIKEAKKLKEIAR